ncbi:helix-turn-helix domain-containing protein [Ectobacillus ponti]|uniref:XRE family transcriptional regulator n=1 Tax=Ectobacillus ponti TaxID=2961894 RepID=A0AA41X2P5_9BACI|nr:XRE family transcriptional regulator [Ectobacillus ponti]MCP8967612.1 XRE family transcriptional regulator [Ectobacillus ponti]
MHQINLSIGKNLSRIRKERGLSLDKVSEMTGVSKAMLGQIERGESNPTVTTLWKIANGLRLSFSSLIKEEAPSITIVSTDTVDPIVEDDGKYRVYSLFPFHPKKQFEMFSIVLEPGCIHESEAHHAGMEEYIMVSAGTLEILLEQEIYVVEQDSSIHFQADRPHVYRNSGSSTVKCFMVIHYPSE